MYFIIIFRAFDVDLLYIAQTLKIPIAEVAVDWQEMAGKNIYVTILLWKNHDMSSIFNLILDSLNTPLLYLFAGSKLDPITSSFQMAKDLLLIRIRYMFGIWNISQD